MSQPTAPWDEDDIRWAAVCERNAQADGQFFYSVATTGVYCRPSCPSRTARRTNVRFHPTAVDAEAAGFRPCRRCRPDQPSQKLRRAAIVERVCRWIEGADSALTLQELAERAGISPFHLHRLFKQTTGLTPRAYAAARRGGKVRAELSRRETVTEAIYGAGYNSSGRFYEEAQRFLGMTPGRFRAGGEGMQITFAVGQTSLGAILVGATELGVCVILLGDDPEALLHDMERRFPKAELIGGDEAFEGLVAKVVGAVERPEVGLELPLDIRGTAFQQRVWSALRAIPAGKTVTYTEIAEAIGAPTAARAVAAACAANPLAVAIPCHRVVRTDGGLSGYRWGVERKRELLEREGKR